MVERKNYATSFLEPIHNRFRIDKRALTLACVAIQIEGVKECE